MSDITQDDARVDKRWKAHETLEVMPPRRYLVPYKENRSAARNDRTKQEGKVLMTADRVRVCTVIPGTARPSTLLEKMSGSVFC